MKSINEAIQYCIDRAPITEQKKDPSKRTANILAASLISLCLILLFIPTKGCGQDCNERPVLIIVSPSVTFGKLMQPSIKVGLWQNTSTSGLSLFVGYRNNLPTGGTVKPATSPVSHYTGTWIGEIGYHARVNKIITIQGYAGANKFRYYLGADVLAQINYNLMAGISFTDGRAGIGIYFRLN